MSELHYNQWAEIYHAIATQMYDYKDNRAELVRLLEQSFNNNNIKIPDDKLYLFKKVIDPFTILTLLNISSSQNRKKLILHFSKTLGLDIELPSDTLGTAKPRYFLPINEDSDRLWELFIAAIEYAAAPCELTKKSLAIIYQDAMSIQRYCTTLTDYWNITVGLFFIRPFKYAKICKHSRLFIEEARVQEVLDVFPKIIYNFVPDFDDYIMICQKLKELAQNESYNFNNIPEFSHVSYNTYAYLIRERRDRVGNYKNEFYHWCPLILNAVKELTNNMPNQAPHLDDIRHKIEVDEGLEIGEMKSNEEYSKSFKKFYQIVRNLGLIENAGIGYYVTTQLGETIELTDHVLEELYQKSSYEVEPLSFTKKPHYWVYTPGKAASKWEEFSKNGIMGINADIGDFSKYSKVDDIVVALQDTFEINDKLYKIAQSIFEFTQVLQVGDIVYAKKGTTILGRGVVESNYIYDITQAGYNHIHKVRWTHDTSQDVTFKLGNSMFMRIPPTTKNLQQFESVYS